MLKKEIFQMQQFRYIFCLIKLFFILLTREYQTSLQTSPAEPDATAYPFYPYPYGPADIPIYLGMFKGDVEVYKHVRVVFAGRDGSGKTTVCRRLQNKKVDLSIREPTIGSVLHPNWFLIDEESNEWIQNDDKSGSEMLELRLGSMMRKAKTKGAIQSPFASSETDDLIERHYWEFEAIQRASKSVNMNGALLSLWDMGGHSSFQTPHNVFISSHGVYLLVFRLTDFLTEKLETDRLKKWIRLIGTFSSVEMNSSKLKEHEPPLVFVGTFLDELKKTTKNVNKQIEAIKFRISKFPELSSHKFVRFCTLDNSKGMKPGIQNPQPSSLSTDEDEGLRKLRLTILELAEHQDQWGRKLPTRWLYLEKDLLKARERGRKILTLKEVIDMNKTSIAPLEDGNEIVLALEYLHCTRSVIYFREFEHVINDPQWLADFFSLLITDDQFLPKDDLILARDLNMYKSNGELTQQLIDALLGLEQNKDFLPHKSILLALMEKFGLVVRERISGPHSADEHFSNKYTIPSKLMELQNTDSVNKQVSNIKLNNLAVSKTLCFIFSDVFVPEELFNRVFATIMKTYRTASIKTRQQEHEETLTATETPCLYRGFGCFEVNDLCRMILSMHWERSTIAVTLFSPSESSLPPNSGALVRKTLEKILQETLQMSNQNHFKYTHKLHCNFHLSPYDTPVDIYSVIQAEEGMSCKGEECRGKHRLKISDVSFWDIQVTLQEQERPCQVTLQDSASGMEETFLDKRPTPAELGRLSHEVEASKCQLLFISLGLSEQEISNTEHEARNLTAVTQITRMFLKWTYNYPNQTFRHIKDAMSEVGMSTDNIRNVVETGWECVTLGDMESHKDRLDRPLMEGEIGSLVENINKGYFNLCLELGLSVFNIERCEIDRSDNVKRRVETLINLWINTYQEQATVIRIVKAMKLCKMNWYSAAMAYCDSGESEVQERSCLSRRRCAIL